MRILLVYPNMAGMNMLPPALGLFTSILKSAGHEVALFDTTNYPDLDNGFDSDKSKAEHLNARPFDDSLLRQHDRHSPAPQDFAQKVASWKPGLIAISATEDMYPIALRLLCALPKDRPRVVLGGVFATFAPELALRLSQGLIDHVLIGEGEDSLPEFCRRLEKGQDPAGTPGLWSLNPKISSPLPRPVNTETLPLPDYGLFEESRFLRPMQGKLWRMLPVETIRGCPYTCAYCNSPAQTEAYRQAGHRFFRMRSADKVRAELRHLAGAYGADSFYFWADSFLAYNDRDFAAFCDMYSEFKLPFWIQTRPETVIEERFRRLKEIGLLRVSFGIEHGNEAFREKHLARRVSNRTIVERLAILNRLGIPFSTNNILGFPHETRQLAFDTIELNRQVLADGYNAYSYTPFHGTPLRAQAEALGFIKPDSLASCITKPTILDMPQFSRDAIEGLRRCFVLYVKMPKERWSRIAQAEKLTPEGDRAWQELRDECREKYMGFDLPPAISEVPKK